MDFYCFLNLFFLQLDWLNQNDKNGFLTQNQPSQRSTIGKIFVKLFNNIFQRLIVLNSFVLEHLIIWRHLFIPHFKLPFMSVRFKSSEQYWIDHTNRQFDIWSYLSAKRKLWKGVDRHVKWLIDPLKTTREIFTFYRLVHCSINKTKCSSQQAAW